MTRSKTGEAVGASRRTSAARKKLRRFIKAGEKRSDLPAWRRGRAVLAYIEGRRVIELAAELDVTRGAINRWLQWYEAAGVEGLLTGKAPGPSPKLNEDQLVELASQIGEGPQSAGYGIGVWTGPMIADWIEQRFGIRYHNHHVRVCSTAWAFRFSVRESGWPTPMPRRRRTGYAKDFPPSKKSRCLSRPSDVWRRGELLA